MKRPLLFTTLLTAAALAFSAGSAAASLLIGIFNSSSPAITATSNGTIQFDAPGIGTFHCNVTLTGTLPTLWRPDPLGTPVLPIGGIDAAAIQCPPGVDVIAFTATSPPWSMSLERVLLTAGGATGFLVTLLGVDFQVIASGTRCIYGGAVLALFDEGSSVLEVPPSNSLAVVGGPCSLPMTVSGRFTLLGLQVI